MKKKRQKKVAAWQGCEPVAGSELKRADGGLPRINSPLRVLASRQHEAKYRTNMAMKS